MDALRSASSENLYGKLNSLKRIENQKYSCMIWNYFLGNSFFSLNCIPKVKDRSEVDLFNKFGRCKKSPNAERKMSWPPKKAPSTLERSGCRLQALEELKKTTCIGMSLAFGLLKQRCPSPSDSKRIRRRKGHRLEVN